MSTCSSYPPPSLRKFAVLVDPMAILEILANPMVRLRKLATLADPEVILLSLRTRRNANHIFSRATTRVQFQRWSLSPSLDPWRECANRKQGERVYWCNKTQVSTLLSQ